MLTKFTLFVIIAICAVHSPAKNSKYPHYTFTLPDGYVGWIQIILNDPQAQRLSWRDNGCEINIPDSGISRTSDLRVHSGRAADEFYYRVLLSDGNVKLTPIPSGYVLSGDSHGGFGVMDTGGKGRGYSWFVFIGPPDLRATVPLADWDKVVEEHRKMHNGNARVEAPEQYPTPGRMVIASSPPKQ
jgi:hypothetical protein